MRSIHTHEVFYSVNSEGLRANWPAERCLGDVPEDEARRLLATEEPTITPHGTVTGVTVWLQVKGDPEACWLSGRGFVI